MSDTLEFLLRHGYAVLFLWVLAEQVGVPLPSVPLLLAAGAAAGAGRLSLGGALALAVAASLLGDLLWYELGRRRGARVLRLLCRIALEPDSCVRRTEVAFGRHGPRAVVLAKFVPGLSTAVPPLAGMVGMGRGRFLWCDALGAGIWSGSFLGLGYLFSHELERVAERASRLGAGLGAALAAALAAYVLWRYRKRRQFLRSLRVARVTPAELRASLEAGSPIAVVDLRHRVDVEASPFTIPGAIQLEPERVEAEHERIPRDRDVVLFCT
jgi:membrane protein DedA with SNARE-associated domain